ncbi:10980_t:CDS:1, partial [Funneliformis geosporum]
QYPTFRKWVYGSLITMGLLCLFAGIFYLVKFCPENSAEIKKLKKQEKQLEREIESQ